MPNIIDEKTFQKSLKQVTGKLNSRSLFSELFLSCVAIERASWLTVIKSQKLKIAAEILIAC